MNSLPLRVHLKKSLTFPTLAVRRETALGDLWNFHFKYVPFQFRINTEENKEEITVSIKLLFTAYIINNERNDNYVFKGGFNRFSAQYCQKNI